MQSWWAEETFKHILLTPNRVFVTLFSLNELNQKQQVKIGGAEHWMCPEDTDVRDCAGMCHQQPEASDAFAHVSTNCWARGDGKSRSTHTHLWNTASAADAGATTHIWSHKSAAGHFNNHSNYKHVPYLTSNTYSSKAQRIRDLHSCI